MIKKEEKNKMFTDICINKLFKFMSFNKSEREIQKNAKSLSENFVCKHHNCKNLECYLHIVNNPSIFY